MDEKKQKLIEKIKEDFPNKSEKEINQIVADLPEMLKEPLASVLNQWLDNKEIEDVTIEGINLREYQKANNLYFLSAIKGLAHLQDPNIDPIKKSRIKSIYQKSITG